MSTAIVPAKVSHILPLEVFTIERGGRNAVTLPSGQVASDIELLGYDERRRIAKYELRVANDSASMLACYAYAVRGAGGQRPVTCTSIAVMPFSGVAVAFELPLPYIGNFDRITVEMHGDGIDLSSDTVPPNRDYRVLVRRSITLATAALGTFVAALTGLAQPHIVALSAPGEALSGTTIHVAYESRGFGGVSYGLTGPDGESVQAGVSKAFNGSIPFTMPEVPSTRSYIASVEEHNLLGGDARTAVIRDLATPPPKMLTHVVEPAEISTLGSEYAQVVSGAKIGVRYSYIAKTGTLRLLDARDGVWAAAPADPKGYTEFKAPHVDQPQDFRIALHVERGSTSADSQVGVTVTPATPAPEPFKAINGTPLQMTAKPLHAGDPIPLRVTRQVADLHVAMQDPHGNEIEGFNIDGTEAALHAPAHIDAGKYTMVVTYADRNGQETVVVPLIFLPK